MEALEAIRSRRSVPRVLPERPMRDEIEILLDAAVQAPNHHLTQPWRFIVLTGSALDDLGEAMAARVRLQYADDPSVEDRVEKEKQRPHRAPVIITVVYVPSDHPKAIEVEDRYALGAAIQNVLLAARATGLGAYLRTGPAAEHPGVKAQLGLQSGEEIAGFVYVGYPEDLPASESPRRTPAGELTEWRGWDKGSGDAPGLET